MKYILFLFLFGALICNGQTPAFQASSASFGTASASSSFDGTGNMLLTNKANGSVFFVGTNKHIHVLDNFGSRIDFSSNCFAITWANGQTFWGTNTGDFYISGTYHGGGLGGSGPTNWPYIAITNAPWITGYPSQWPVASITNLPAYQPASAILSNIVTAPLTNANNLLKSPLTGNYFTSTFVTNADGSVSQSNSVSLSAAQIAAAGGLTNSLPQPVLFRFNTTPNQGLLSGLNYISVQYGAFSPAEYASAIPIGCTGIVSNFCVHVYNYNALPAGTNFVFRFSTNGVGTGNALTITETGGGGVNFSWIGQDITGSFPITSPTNLVSITCSNTGGVGINNQTMSGWFWVYPTNNLNAILP
jgi:hypothetical protein